MTDKLTEGSIAALNQLKTVNNDALVDACVKATDVPDQYAMAVHHTRLQTINELGVILLSVGKNDKIIMNETTADALLTNIGRKHVAKWLTGAKE